VGRRVLFIRVQVKGPATTNITVRFPVELVLKAYEMGSLESLVGDEAPFVEQAVEMIRQGAVGSLVDVETEDTFVKIEVMKV
jgi:hypothetical protein